MTTEAILSMKDLLAQKLNSAYEFGLDKVNAVVTAYLASLNADVNEFVSSIAEVTTDRARAFKGSTSGTMSEVKEYAVTDDDQSTDLWEVMFPLRKYQSTLGWTNDYLKRATPAELARKVLELESKHKRTLWNTFKKAIYNKTNETFVDFGVDGVSLTVRRFWNNDSSFVPQNASGSSFATTHNHYLYLSSGSDVTDSEIDRIINTILEHNETQGVGIFVHKNDVSKMSALTNWKALDYPVLNIQSTTTPYQRLSMEDVGNRLEGYFRGYPVFVKPWAIENYILAMAVEGSMKPLAFRQYPQTAMQGLQINAMVDSSPLVAQTATAWFGVGALNRSAGAVLYTSGSTTYTNPTIS